MHVSTQIRGGDMDDFFSHKIIKCPPVLPKNGEVGSGDKTELLKCFKKISAFSESQSTPPIVDTASLEGLLIVNMTKLKKNRLFEMFCKDCFIS